MRDYVGTPINKHDIVVYPIRTGSSMYVNHAIVVNVDDDKGQLKCIIHRGGSVYDRKQAKMVPQDRWHTITLTSGTKRAVVVSAENFNHTTGTRFLEKIKELKEV